MSSRVAVVTGGAQGIGKQTAHVLNELGWSLVGDITSEAFVQSAVDATVKRKVIEVNRQVCLQREQTRAYWFNAHACGRVGSKGCSCQCCVPMGRFARPDDIAQAIAWLDNRRIVAVVAPSSP